MSIYSVGLSQIQAPRFSGTVAAAAGAVAHPGPSFSYPTKYSEEIRQLSRTRLDEFLDPQYAGKIWQIQLKEEREGLQAKIIPHGKPSHTIDDKKAVIVSQNPGETIEAFLNRAFDASIELARNTVIK